MGCNLLKHAYNHFDTRGTPHHDMIFNHRIDRLLYRYVPSLYLFRVCTRTCLHMRECVDTFMYIYTQVTRVCQDIRTTSHEWYI